MAINNIQPELTILLLEVKKAHAPHATWYGGTQARALDSTQQQLMQLLTKARTLSLNMLGAWPYHMAWHVMHGMQATALHSTQPQLMRLLLEARMLSFS